MPPGAAWRRPQRHAGVAQPVARVGVGFNGARLAAARLAGLTQEQLAAGLGSDPARVSEWERGLFYRDRS
jgi:DNA-binding transcriptional regulator YiaG